MAERRKNPRNRTYLGGVLSFNDRYSTLECIIRNKSEAGACLAVEGTVMLPDEFDLTVTRNEQSHRARMIWRTGTEAGVCLLSPGESSIVALNWARRLRARDTENAALRRRIADLSSGG